MGQVTLLSGTAELDLDVDAQLAQRMLLEQLALQGVAVAVSAALERQHLRVGDADAFLGVGEDRIDAGLEDVAAGPFEQARDRAFPAGSSRKSRGLRCFSTTSASTILSPIHMAKPEIEAPAGSGKWKTPSSTPSVWLTNVSSIMVRAIWSRMSTDNLVFADRQRHVPAIDAGDQRADRLVAGGPLERLQPEGLAGHSDQLLFLDPVVLRALDDDLVLAMSQHLDGGVLGDADFELSLDDAQLVGLDDFDRGAGPEDDARAFHEPQGGGVGAAGVGAQPVAGLEQELAG